MSDAVRRAARQFGGALFANPNMPASQLEALLRTSLEFWDVESERTEVVKLASEIAVSRRSELIASDVLAKAAELMRGRS